jgi:hypothetical protein
VGPTGGNDISHSAPSTTSDSTTGSSSHPSTTTGSSSSTAGGDSPHTGDAQQSSSANGQDKSQVEVAAKSAEGADDSLLLAALVLGFTFAVSGVVVAAGMRGGRRAR